MEPPSARSAEALHLQLRRRLAAWRAAGASPQVMRWLREGASCEWTSGPPPPYHHGVSFSDPGALSPEESAFLEKEVVRCFGTGAWETAPPDERTHVCRAHLVPKKGGKFRLVVDLRPTNAFCREFRCKYETLRNLSRLAGRGDWMFSWDLADGYHQIGVHADSRRYMTFALPPAPDAPAGAPPRYIRCAALPFGWSASPFIFTKVMRVMVRMLRSPMAPTIERLRLRTAAGRRFVLRVRRGSRGPHVRGIRVLPYVDDFLAVARTRREALECRARVQQVLDTLGISRHPDKGVWEPTQRLEHLGLDVDTRDGLFRVPPHKLTELMRQARLLRRAAAADTRLVKTRTLAAFIGYAQSVYLAVPEARFYLRSLHDALATRRGWSGKVRLERQALRDLGWWKHIGTAAVSRAIWRSPAQQTLHCDASRLGWGGVLNGTVPASGMHRGRDRGRHINFLELAAVHKTIASFEAALRGSSVLLFEDNMTVVHVLTNRTSRSPELMHELRRLWRLIDTLGIDLSVRYIPTDANTMADALSRGAPTDELTLTDAAFFELDRRWGPHTIDQYASAANARLPRFHTAFPDAKGLGAGAMAHDWSGENNYAFPPLAELPRVAQLLFERPSIACTVVAPYWPTQAWFQQLVDVSLHVEICAASTVSTLPPALHASARHAMAGATLAFIRVPGCLRGGGRTARS